MGKKKSLSAAAEPRSAPTKPLPPASTGLRAESHWPQAYAELLADLKSRLRGAQVKAALAVNRELIELYWEIGGLIVARQQGEAWGAAVIEQLAADLQAEFPGVPGLSRANLFRMRSLYVAYAQGLTIVAQAVRQLGAEIVPQAVGQLGTKEVAQPARQLDVPVTPALAPIPPPIAAIPWGHNIVLLEKLNDTETRLWYARQTTANGWSRSVLTMQIETDAHLRQGQALTNFDRTLPASQSDLAQQLLKDPYTFDFLTLAADAKERDLERSLIAHLKEFLLELGSGFAFVGNQYHLEVGGEDFYLDLLFYHLQLRCFVVVELKTEAFKPEFAGKMNFYLAAVDAELRHMNDGRSIGLLLCKEKNRLIVEYALQDSNRPLGVASFRLLPQELQANLPSPDQLAAEFDNYSS